MIDFVKASKDNVFDVELLRMMFCILYKINSLVSTAVQFCQVKVSF